MSESNTPSPPGGAGPVRDPAASTFVLTPLQKGFLAETLLASDKGVNIEQIVWELDHVPDADRFRAAWQSALDAFDALRLSFAYISSLKPEERP